MSMTFKEILSLTNLNKPEFSRRYDIPIRTLENWAAGVRKPPAYVLTLLERAVREDFADNLGNQSKQDI